MIFDAHLHIQPWAMLKPRARELLSQGRDAEATLAVMKDPRNLPAFLDREGVERVVSINYESPTIMGFTKAANDFIFDYAKESAGRVIPVGSIDPKRTRSPAKDMARFLKAGMRGFKVHPSHQEVRPNAYRDGLKAQAAIYAICEREGLPLYIHTGTSIFPGARNVYADPIYTDDIAIDYPKLTIILAHGGRPLWMDTCFFLVRRHPNVMMDLSSIPPKLVMQYFPRLEEIADKVVFGSDWPAPGVPGIRANADAVGRLPISEKARRSILYDNAKRLFDR